MAEVQHSQSLLERVQAFAQTVDQPGDALIPVEDLSFFYSIAGEIARACSADGGAALMVAVDGHTAAQIETIDSVRAAAETLYVFGEVPPSWVNSERLCPCEYSGDVGEEDRLLVVFSEDINLAILGHLHTRGTGDEKAFRGGWTGLRPIVKFIAESAFAEAGNRHRAPKLPDANPVLNRSSACATRLMAWLTQRSASLEREVTMDKHDLFSVLEILKAISAKRRAHDILFVFVEKIARAVDIDRCSVVRIWGGENRGHVLASHEDETVNDLIIDLSKYPELSRAIETHEKVVANDVRRDPLTCEFAKELRQAHIGSLLVVPIVLFDQNVGSLLLRAARNRRPFRPREISFCEIVAEAAANALERAHLFEGIQRANERLEHLAVTDGLTGAYNHRHFRERLEEELQRARRYSIPLSCLIFDIDNFKKINDTYGHLQGDHVLREMASRTVRTVRKSDIVARYGGEEFVVIMPQTGAEGAKAEAERLHRELSTRPYQGMPESHLITVSIGVGILDHESMLDCEALIRVADSALYEAKRQGKNKVVVANPRGEMS